MASSDVAVELYDGPTNGVWRATQDIYHEDFGHGWVQGAGKGWVSVRFETRATGPGKMRTLRIDDPKLQPADPVDSLAWQDWLDSEH